MATFLIQMSAAIPQIALLTAERWYQTGHTNACSVLIVAHILHCNTNAGITDHAGYTMSNCEIHSV